MTYLHLTPVGPEWPYSRQQLQADNPNVSFPIAPNAEDLEPFGVFLVESTDPPEHDSILQRPIEAQPIERDGQWFQAWELEQLPPPPPPEPVADWGTFKRQMLGNPNVNVAMVAAMPAVPLAVLALPVSLERAVSGDPDDFRACWLTIRRAVHVPREVLDAVAAAAAAANLPAEFLEVLA